MDFFMVVRLFVFDVYAVMEFLLLKEYRLQHEEKHRYNCLRNYVRLLFRYLDNKKIFIKQKDSLNLQTSVDVVRYAESLVSDEFL